MGSAHISFKCQWIPAFVPIVLNTDPLLSFTTSTQKSSFHAHHYRDTHWEGSCSLASCTPRCETGEQIQPSESAEGPNSSSRGGTKQPLALQATLVHPALLPRRQITPVTPRNFFSFYLPPPPAEFQSQPLQPNSLAPLTSPYGKLIAQNSLTRTCF